MRTRTLLILATALTLTTVAVVQVWVDLSASGPAPVTAASPVMTSPVMTSTRALGVLHAWDRRRRAAWARADPQVLARLYTLRSRAGAEDVRDLRRWRARSLRVVGLRQQVAAVRVDVETSRCLVLTVTDRTVEGLAVGAGRRTVLPHSDWQRHRIRLRRRRGHWLVAEVTAQPAR